MIEAGSGNGGRAGHDEPALQTGGPYLRLKGLTKVFPGKTDAQDVIAVENLSLDVRSGEMITLLGPSGCGKTTSLRMIAGFESLSEGVISITGEDVERLPPNRRHMGMVFQNYALFPHLDVGANVEYGLRVQRVDVKRRRARVRQMLELVDLEDSIGKMPAQLSGGQQQRVSLARALITEPRILLFDEPLSNLDANLRVYMREQIREIQQRVGITSIYVTHDRQEAMSVSDRIAIMNKGHLQQVGTGGDVYNRPSNEFVAKFMGNADIMEVTVKGVDGDVVTVEVDGKNLHVRRNDTQVSPGSIARCVFRPESWRVHDTGTLSATVKRSVFYGPCAEYQVRFAEQDLTIEDYDANSNGVKGPGDSIRFDLKLNAAGLLPAGAED